MTLYTCKLEETGFSRNVMIAAKVDLFFEMVDFPEPERVQP